MTFGRWIVAALAVLGLWALVGPATWAKKDNGKGKGGGGGGAAPAEIAYIRARAQTNTNRKDESALMVMAADGSGQTVVRKESFGFGTGYLMQDPVWSPDGSRIAFVRLAWGWNGPDWGIHTVRVDGSGLVRITDRGAEPAWSPDGTRIAYAKDGIRIVDAADGANETRLTTAGGSPTWSPDGEKLAYLGGGAVLVHDLATGAVTNVTAGGPLASLELQDLDWSNDGDRIALSAGTKPDADGCYVRDVWIIDLGDPTSPVNLTDTSQDDPAHEWAEVGPSWSPDDASVVFSRGGDLHVIDADGSGLTRIAEGVPSGKWDGEGLRSPDWKP